MLCRRSISLRRRTRQSRKTKRSVHGLKPVRQLQKNVQFQYILQSKKRLQIKTASLSLCGGFCLSSRRHTVLYSANGALARAPTVAAVYRHSSIPRHACEGAELGLAVFERCQRHGPAKCNEGEWVSSERAKVKRKKDS